MLFGAARRRPLRALSGNHFIDDFGHSGLQ
jgi:hypothetical protein